MTIEPVSPVFLDIPSVLQKEEHLSLKTLPFVIDPPRNSGRLRGERLEYIIVKPDPKDNISYSKMRWIGKALKWIWHVLIEETVRVIVEKGINEGLDTVGPEDEPEKPEGEDENEKIPEETPPEKTPPPEEEKEAPPAEPEWI